MFDVIVYFMIQLIEFIPYMIGIYVLFDLIGSLLFGRS